MGADKLNELVKRESLKLATNERYEQGLEQGRTEGIEQGIEQTIIAMFNQNIDLETISKIIKKSIEEIETILNKN